MVDKAPFAFAWATIEFRLTNFDVQNLIFDVQNLMFDIRYSFLT